MASMIEEIDDIHYEGNLTSRLMKYVMRYLKPMIISLVLVLVVIGVELFRPTLIADAIDNHIEGYNIPYAIVEYDENATYFNGKYLDKNGESNRYAQLVIYDDGYYYFEELTKNQSELLYELSESTIEPISYTPENVVIQLNDTNITGYKLTVDELKQLRESDLTGIVKIAIIYAVLMILGMLASIIQMWTLQKTGQQIIYEIRQELFDHVHSLPLRFFDTHPIGRIVTRITNDVESLHDMYANILVRLFRSAVKIIGLAFVMLMLNVKLALYSFVMLPVILVLTYYFRTISRKLYRNVRTKISLLNTFLSENISGMKLIQIFAKEEKKYEEFKNQSYDLYRAYFKEIMNFSIFRPLIYLVSQIALVIVLFKGSESVLIQSISIGTLYIFINYINSFFEPIQDLAEQFSTLQNAFASAEKIFTLLDEKNTIQEVENPIVKHEIKGKIEFKNVWFAYENDDYVIKDVSFVIEPGETVAFVGATGAGKSSILNLIGRY